MYDRILVPMALDHGLSGATLQTAKTLCNPGGEIVALHVYEEPHGSVSPFLDKQTMQAAFQRSKALLEEKTAGIQGVTAKLVIGHTYRSIIDYAAEQDIGCIVMGSHKPGLSDYFLGTTASRVVRHAPCAVHVYRNS